MRVISQRFLRDFWGKYPDAEEPLRDWFRIALAAQWRSLQDVRKIYSNADGVRTPDGVLTVFNIRGNRYRLIARIKYEWKLINVRYVLTHAEYNLEKWKE